MPLFMVILYVGLAAFGCLWIGLRAGGAGFRALAGDGWAGAAWGAAMAAAVVGVAALASRSFRWFAVMEDELRGLVGPLRLPQIAALALASGTAEELMFRGAAQAAWGWIPAALLFGFLHLPATRALVPWTILATGLGALFGWVADRTGGIIGVTVAHVGINAINLWRLCGRVPARRPT
jgi:membrane protease YdiL (CAAX protease family)